MNSLGVDWYIPNRRTRVFTSTQATSNLIQVLSEDGYSYAEMVNQIHYDPDAVKLCNIMVEQGYGHENSLKPLSEWVKK